MEKQKEYSKTLFSFNIFVPINIPISGKQEFLDKLEKYCEQKSTTKTDYMNKLLSSRLRNAGIKGSKELLTESGDYKLIVRSIKDSINGFLGTANLSRYSIEEVKKEWKNEGFM